MLGHVGTVERSSSLGSKSQDVPRCPKMSVDPDTQTLQHSAAQFRTKPQLDPNWTRLRMAYFSEKPGVVLRRNGHTAATCGYSGFGVGRQLNNCVGILRHQATYDFDDFSVSTIFNGFSYDFQRKFQTVLLISVTFQSVSAGEQCFKAGQQLVNFPLWEVSHWVSHWVSQFHMGFTRFKSCLTLFNIV